jgi:hypothetical protein
VGCSTCSSPRWPPTRWPRCGSRAASAIFYALLATLIVPAQLTYIPSFVLAVNVFHYYDTLPALIFPNLVSAFNIFLLRQAFRGVPNDLLDAAAWTAPASSGSGGRSAADRPAVAGRGRDLHVRDVVERLPVAVADAPHARRDDAARGLAALQGFFSSDFRSIAAGVTIT